MHFGIIITTFLIVTVSATPAACSSQRDEWCCSPLAPGDMHLDAHRKPVSMDPTHLTCYYSQPGHGGWVTCIFSTITGIRTRGSQFECPYNIYRNPGTGKCPFYPDYPD